MVDETARIGYRVAYWLLAMAGGSAVVLAMGDPGALGSTWSRYWPWLIACWWLAFQVPPLVMGRGLALDAVEVAGIVVVIVAGTLWTAATHMTPQIVPPSARLAGDMDLFDLLGENYEFRDHFEWTLPPGVALELRNTYGSVDISASDDDRVHLDTLTGVRAAGIDQAQAIAGSLVFRVEEGETVHVIDSSHGEMAPGLARRFRTHLEVRVPPSARIMVENRRGTVRVSGLQGPQAISTSDGEILARPVAGALEATVRRGDISVVYDERPQDPVTLNAESGDIRLDLPPDSAFAVEGEIQSGSFVSDFAQIVRSSPGGGRALPGDVGHFAIEGEVGDGTAEMRLQVTGGRIALIDRARWPWGSFR